MTLSVRWTSWCVWLSQHRQREKTGPHVRGLCPLLPCIPRSDRREPSQDRWSRRGGGVEEVWYWSPSVNRKPQKATDGREVSGFHLGKRRSVQRRVGGRRYLRRSKGKGDMRRIRRRSRSKAQWESHDPKTPKAKAERPVFQSNEARRRDRGRWRWLVRRQSGRCNRAIAENAGCWVT